MKTLIAALFLISSVKAFSGSCDITTDRKACPGKEAEMLKPYNGVNPTTDKKTADSEAKCKEMAEKASKIIRAGTLASKNVTAKFEGKEIAKAADSKECK